MVYRLQIFFLFLSVLDKILKVLLPVRFRKQKVSVKLTQNMHITENTKATQ